MTTTTEDDVDPPGLRARLLGSARGRLAATIIIGMIIAGTLVVLAVRAVLLSQLDDRVESALVQERSEFERFVERGVDPDDGASLAGDLGRAGILFIEQNVLAENEVVLVLSDNAPPVTSAGAPVDLFADAEFVADLRDRSDAALRDIDTAAGPATVLTVPVLRGEQRTGSLVFAVFTGDERAEIDSALRVIAQVIAAAVIVVGLLAWVIAGAVLRPVRDLTETARRITDEDLSARLFDPGGEDEVAVLVRTFNGMLDRLERASAAQREFLADAGHELRTPLTVVHGHVEQLEAGIVPPAEREETLALVREEVARMGRLVDDLMLLARSEQPDFLRPESVQLAELTERIFRRAHALEGPDWSVEAADGEIRADGERLIQAALNLVANAARHTPAGAPVVIGSSLDGRECAIWVDDSGPGVPAADRETMVRRFARGPDRRRAGTGLGLAIAQTVAEAHGGRIAIGDGEGGGARVAIVIPRDGGEAP